MVEALGNKLLAGPPFADHKYRAIERSGTARPLDRVEKGEALPHELIGPLHSLTVGVKAHELARYFGAFLAENSQIWQISKYSA
jgi:hypothetical protein